MEKNVVTYLAADRGNTARLYTVYDAKACRMRFDIFSVDDETNVYVEIARISRWSGARYRPVQSNRILIPGGPGTIVINALPDDEGEHEHEGASRGQKTVA